MLKLKLHSTVDIITNSSTVVYTRAQEGSIKALKSAIDGLLQAFGIDKTADDLFTFALEYEEDVVYEWRLWQIRDEEGLSWEEAEARMIEYEKDPPEWWNDFEDRTKDINVKVVAKTDDQNLSIVAENLTKYIDTFYKDGYRDG